MTFRTRALRVVALSLSVVIAALALSKLPALSGQTSTAMAGPGVKLELDGGHGSGTYLGNGVILTAAHVARASKDGKFTVKSDDQKERPATVLWANDTYDIALIRLDDTHANIRTATLACRDPQTAEPIYVDGSPVNQEFLRTWGHVAGSARWNEHWRAVVPTDVTIVPGMSGGGVFDANGDVIGVAVGVMISPLSQFESSMTGVTYIVPASAVCMLTGRT